MDEGGLLVLQPNDADLSDNSRGWNVEVYVTPPAGAKVSTPGIPTPKDPSKPSEAKDRCCEKRLLFLLNRNKGFYNRAIWLLQDPVERRILLELALKDYPHILERLDNIPLAVDGNYVAFPYNPPNNPPNRDLEPSDRRSRESLRETVLSNDGVVYEPKVSKVTIPTRRLFAEAQLGHCNACEKRDVTRFWKWEESPCDKPPTIERIRPGPQGETPTVTQTSLPPSVVNITQPPAAPDPVGLAAALNVLGTPNLFRGRGI